MRRRFAAATAALAIPFAVVSASGCGQLATTGAGWISTSAAVAGVQCTHPGACTAYPHEQGGLTSSLVLSQQPCFSADGSNSAACCVDTASPCASWAGSAVESGGCFGQGVVTFSLEVVSAGVGAALVIDGTSIPVPKRGTHVVQVERDGRWERISVGTAEANVSVPQAGPRLVTLALSTIRGGTPTVRFAATPPGAAPGAQPAAFAPGAGGVWSASGELLHVNTLGHVIITVPPAAWDTCSPCAVVKDPTASAFGTVPINGTLSFMPGTRIRLGALSVSPLAVASATAFAVNVTNATSPPLPPLPSPSPSPPLPPWPPAPPLAGMQYAATIATSASVSQGALSAAATAAAGTTFFAFISPASMVMVYSSVTASWARDAAAKLGVAASVSHVPYQLHASSVMFIVLRPSFCASKAVAAISANGCSPVTAVNLYTPGDSMPTVGQLSLAASVVPSAMATATDDVEIVTVDENAPLLTGGVQVAAWGAAILCAVLVAAAVAIAATDMAMRRRERKTHKKHKGLSGYVPRIGAKPFGRNLIL